MKLTLIWLAGLAAVAAPAAPALAHGEYDNLFFVRPHATASAFFEDRADCRNLALHMEDNAAGYTNPEYGALSAMGSELDQTALHEGGLHQRMQQAVFTDCMKRRGWSPAEPTAEETRKLMKADRRRPQLLDDWLKAHEPAPATTIAADKPVPSVPAAQTVKTAAAAPPPEAATPASPTVKAAH